MNKPVDTVLRSFLTFTLCQFLVNFTNAQCPGNVVTNGSFNGPKGEAVTAPGWDIRGATPDVNDVNGPLFSTDGYEWIDTPLPSTDGGTWQNVYSGETFTQTVKLVPCQAYTLCFEYASQPIKWEYKIGDETRVKIVDDPMGVQVDIRDDNGNKTTLTTPVDNSPYTWEPVCFTFIATGSSVSLSFKGTETSYVGIDGVCLQPIPPTKLNTDTAICKGQGVKLEPTTAISGATYTWQDNSKQSSLQVNQPGKYSVKIVTPEGCTITETFNVETKTPPNVQLEGGPVCIGETLTLDAGNPGAEYLWNTGERTQTIKVTKPGKYWALVDTDGTRSCLGGDTVDVEFNPLPSLKLPDISVCDNSAVLDAGTGMDTYKWSTGDNTPTTTVTQSGEYTLEFTSNGCKGYDTVSVNFGTNLSFDLPDDTITCTTTELLIDAGDASTIPGVTYLWNDNSTADSLVVAAPGKYWVTLTTPDGCVGTDTINVSLFNDFNFEIPDDSLNCEIRSVTLDPMVSGAAYNWNTGETSQTIDATSPGVYWVEVTIDGTCSSIDTITVTQSLNMPDAVFSTVEVCEGNIMVFTNESTGPVDSLKWDFGDGGTSTAQNPSHRYDSAGVYDVTLILYNGACGDTLIKPVAVNPLPIVDFSQPAQGCTPLQVNFTDKSSVQGGSIVLWEWDFGDGNTSSQQNPAHTYTVPGTYSVSLSIITDARCGGTITKENIIHVFDYPEADFSSNPPKTTITSPQIKFTDQSINNTSYWHWQFGDGDSANVANPVHTYKDTGHYTVTLVVINENGCSDTISKIVEILPEWSFYIPNVFTPNGNGKNEVFIGKGIGVIEHEMWIYDRWGLLVYHSNSTPLDQAIPWDGRINNSTMVAQEDVYVYVVHITDVFEKPHKYIGHVNLVK